MPRLRDITAEFRALSAKRYRRDSHRVMVFKKEFKALVDARLQKDGIPPDNFWEAFFYDADVRVSEAAIQALGAFAREMKFGGNIYTSLRVFEPF